MSSFKTGSEDVVFRTISENDASEHQYELHTSHSTPFDDYEFSSTVNARSNEESFSGSRRQIAHTSRRKSMNHMSQVSKPRISFNLKRYLQGIGALDLLELQKKRREPLLHTAVKENRQDVVELLIERGADLNIRGLKDTTPLHEAAAHGYTDILQVLLRHGADVAAETSMGETPLLLASLAGHNDIVILLMAAGAEGFFDNDLCAIGADNRSL